MHTYTYTGVCVEKNHLTQKVIFEADVPPRKTIIQVIFQIKVQMPVVKNRMLLSTIVNALE